MQPISYRERLQNIMFNTPMILFTALKITLGVVIFWPTVVPMLVLMLALPFKPAEWIAEQWAWILEALVVFDR